jgi:hypothetical protein
MTEDDPKAQAAKRWFGYGRWDAPYWFVGKEPGGADEPEQYLSWLRLGGAELIDCREHDLDCATGKPGDWHGVGAGPKLQPTWRPLIAMLLAYKGAEAYDESAVRRYQDERWGTISGETAVVELSGVAAKSVADTEALRLGNLAERIATIRSNIVKTVPRFIVFYGLGEDPVHLVPYLDHWRAIAKTDLEVGEPIAVDGTIYVVEQHPTAFGTTTQKWTDLGKRLRAMQEG